MSGVFADAFYYIALLNSRDQAHAKVVQITGALRRTIFTTAWVLVEVADALDSTRHRRFVHQFLEGLATDPNTVIIPADEASYARGLTLYGARPDKAWSLTDCISFAVMAELGLTEALTGDHHFEQAGFRALLKAP
jgi:predicted nucleic acid-binding protein